MAKKQDFWKWLAIGLGGVLLIGATVALTKGADSDTRTLGVGDYAIYALDDVTGLADKENKGNLSSNAFYSIDKFDVELAKDAQIKYQLNFYNANKEFIKMETRSNDFDRAEIEGLKGQGVAYVRVEILPIGDVDGVVSIFEKSGYVEQLTVTVKKDVKEEVEDNKTEDEESGDEQTQE